MPVRENNESTRRGGGAGKQCRVFQFGSLETFTEMEFHREFRHEYP